MYKYHKKNFVRWRLVLCATVSLPLLMTAPAADEIHAKTMTSLQVISKPAPAQETPAVLNSAAEGGESTPGTAAVKVLVTADPQVLVAMSLPIQPASEILAMSSVAQVEIHKPVPSTGMSALTGRAVDRQGFTTSRRGDPSAPTYAIAMALFAFLGMISVARRDTPSSLTSKSQRSAKASGQAKLDGGRQGLLPRVVNRLRSLLTSNVRLIRNAK